MKTIALSGKGGTGKSTIAAMTVRWLGEHASKSILAVDADANVGLNELLGVSLSGTVGAIREEMKSRANDLPAGMTKQRFLEYKIQSSLVETADFDLLAMGRPEGPGCYCYANNLLRDILDTLSGNYEYVVIDNEAGMEHLSRRTTRRIDYLLIVSDPIVRGIRTAGKISRLIRELKARVGETYLILNRARGAVAPELEGMIGAEGLTLACTIPEDGLLLETDSGGKPIWPVLAGSPAYAAIGELMKKLDA
jgi:CO dehydrogenase maturation factor